MQDAAVLAEALGEVGLTVEAQYYLENVYRSLGVYRQAIELLQQCIVGLHGALLYESFGLHGLPSVHSRSCLAVCLAECGAFTEGRALAEEGMRIAETANRLDSRAMAYWSADLRTLHQGDIPQAIPMLERALELAQGAHIHLVISWVAAPLGAAYALAGRTAERPCRCWRRPSSGV